MTSVTNLDIHSYFDLPLVNMGARNSDMEGVYIPEQEIGKKKIGVTEQFLSEAETYHKKYSANEYFQYLINNALQRIGAVDPGAVILDIGSGSGNSVLACLELLHDCRIVATDISENVLAILLRYVNQNERYQGRVVPICMDATNGAFYKADTFDLVMGAAVLHHLIDPSAAISAAGKALVSGGRAVFFEPFENGFAILRLAYGEIIRRNEEKKWREKISLRTLLFLKALMHDFEVRTGTDKSADIYRNIDDKWLFTKSYLHDCADRAGFREVDIYPIHNVEAPFTRQTEVNLSLGLNLLPDAFPAWAWDVLRYYDNFFSPELKQDLLLEGCIILKK